MNKYFPVSSDFIERIRKIMDSQKEGQVHYFRVEEDVAMAKGNIKRIEKKDGGEFLIMENDTEIRLDTIITLHGLPGPAYDTYAGFSNSCMDSNVKA